MSGPSTEGLLFDIDGTLITTGGAGGEAWRRAFEEIYDTQVDIRKVTESGMTDPDVGRTALRHVLERDPTQRELALAMAKYMKYLAAAVAESDGYEVLPGVVPRLRQLVDDGCLVGLITGNVEAAAHIKLARGGLNRFFSFGGYGSDSSDRVEVTKCALERGQLVSGGTLDVSSCLGIGDTPRDVTGAHGAGIKSVAVATGNYTADQLREAGADYVLATLEEELPL
ncbi:MAG TPA: HAD family hydrolase [Solirubrobacterales bacterium]|nr:HAD family hydrolase [Solirubrobacterales bacterium]